MACPHSKLQIHAHFGVASAKCRLRFRERLVRNKRFLFTFTSVAITLERCDVEPFCSESCGCACERKAPESRGRPGLAQQTVRCWRPHVAQRPGSYATTCPTCADIVCAGPCVGCPCQPCLYAMPRGIIACVAVLFAAAISVVCAHEASVSPEGVVEPSSSMEWDSDGGYLTYCPASGRFGNQVGSVPVAQTYKRRALLCHCVSCQWGSGCGVWRCARRWTTF